MNEIRRIGDTASADRIGDIIRRHGLPSIVNRFELEFGQDSVDEPAVWIVLHADALPRDPQQATRVVDEIDHFSRGVREKVLDSDMEIFPYFRIVSQEALEA